MGHGSGNADVLLDPRAFAPIDHGWAWMTVIGSLLVHLFSTGFMKSSGIFYAIFLNELKPSPATLSLAFGLPFPVMCLLGPICCSVAEKISVRWSVTIGGALATVALVGMSLMRSVLVTMATMICLGLGYAFSYAPSNYIVGCYFKSKIGLANGLQMAGGSLGQIVMPPFLMYLNLTYGFRGTLLIAAGLAMNFFVSAALFRPLEFYLPRRKPKLEAPCEASKDLGPELVIEGNCIEHDAEEVKLKLDEVMQSPSDGVVSASGTPGILRRHHRHHEPFRSEHNIAHAHARHAAFQQGDSGKDENALSLRDGTKLKLARSHEAVHTAHSRQRWNHSPTRRHLGHGRRALMHLLAGASFTPEPLGGALSVQSIAAVSAQLDGGDELPEKKLDKVMDVCDDQAILGSVDHADDATEHHLGAERSEIAAKEKPKSKESVCKGFLNRWLRLDFSIFRDSVYVLVVLAFAQMHSGNLTNFLYLQVYAKELKLEETLVYLLILFVGIGDLLGRVAGGLFVDRRAVPNVWYLAVTMLAMAGTAFVNIALCRPESLVLHCFLLGLLGGGHMGAFVPLLIEYFGIKRLGLTFSMAFFVAGGGLIPYPMFLGFIVSATGTYWTAMLVACFNFLGCSATWFLVCWVVHVRRRKEQEALHVEVVADDLKEEATVHEQSAKAPT